MTSGMLGHPPLYCSLGVGVNCNPPRRLGARNRDPSAGEINTACQSCNIVGVAGRWACREDIDI